MPGWNGVDAIRTIGTARPGTKVLVVSAVLSQPEVLDAREDLEIVGAVEKPVAVARLLELVREHAGAP